MMSASVRVRRGETVPVEVGEWVGGLVREVDEKEAV